MARLFRPWSASIVALGAVLWLAPQSANAESCSLPADCASGFCEDGVCCDVGCAGPCMACTAAIKGTGTDGTCGPAKAGTECKPAHCSAALTFDPPDTCDGAGKCIDSGPGPSCIDGDPCTFDLCGDTGCEIVYKIDGTECDVGKVCIDNACVPDPGGADGEAGLAGASGGEAGSDAGASGGAAGTSSAPETDDSGCGCRTAGEFGDERGRAWVLALIAAVTWRASIRGWRRIRTSRSRSRRS